MKLAELEQLFEPTAGGAYRCRWGPANPDRDSSRGCNKKLCLVATDRAYLMQLLYELSNRPDAIYVKFSVKPKDGMYLGRCFLSDERTIGELWQKYKVNPKLMCSVQDDDWSIGYRQLG